ncbi:MAG: hypothetical protein D3909_00465 [Candidatus Electrothrix sp. ATG1]|nr:hypothetical protein [Candidatus Electrothrix sp. ATG1]
MKIKSVLTLGFGLGMFLTGCGPDLPFTAKYTSPNQVIIMYQGKQYTLERYGISAPVPFGYRFEEDGDLDLTIDGKLYEVESPYDVDRKKVKKKKKKTVQNKKR